MAVFIATVEALAWIDRQPQRRVLVPLAAALLAATSVAGTIQWGLSPLEPAIPQRDLGGPQLQGGRTAPRPATWCPAGAGVSVTYYLTPQTTHRPVVFEFPNPWVGVNYGRTDTDHGNPATVDWLILDRQTLAPADQALFDRLTEAAAPLTTPAGPPGSTREAGQFRIVRVPTSRGDRLAWPTHRHRRGPTL